MLALSFTPEGVRLPKELGSGLGGPPEVPGSIFTLHKPGQSQIADQGTDLGMILASGEAAEMACICSAWGCHECLLAGCCS